MSIAVRNALVIVATVFTFPPTGCGLCGGPLSIEDCCPPVLRGTLPVELIGAEICLGADIAGFFDFFVFRKESPLLSDIFFSSINCVVMLDVLVLESSCMFNAKVTTRYSRWPKLLKMY